MILCQDSNCTDNIDGDITKVQSVANKVGHIQVCHTIVVPLNKHPRTETDMYETQQLRNQSRTWKWLGIEGKCIINMPCQGVFVGITEA